MAQYLLQKAIILRTSGVQVTPKPDSPEPLTPEPWHTLVLPVGSCQNYGLFLGTLNIRCRIIIRTQKGTIILTTPHVALLILRYPNIPCAYMAYAA